MFVSTLKELKLLSHSITLWQEPEGESREIIQAQCEDVNETSERLALRSNSSIKFTAKDVFFYCEAISLIFKTSGFDIEGDIISLDFPEEIVALDKEERREFAASLEDFDDSENTVVSGTTQHIKKAKTLAGTVAGTDTYSSGNLSGRVTTDKISTNVKASFKPDKISTVDTVINLDEDEQFAQKLAQELDVSFFSIRFETFKFASKRKQSIQVVARDLRYEWLEKIRVENDFDCIATAHHLNDSIETVILNLTKGCGIKGLHGILPIRNKIIRPLLFATKEQIRNYAFANDISFRMDESNETEKYTRNFVRNKVIPKLQDINKNFEATFEQNINRFRDTEILYFEAIENIKKQDVLHKDKTSSTSILDKEVIVFKKPFSNKIKEDFYT